jgi:putative cardiolipin synthase
MRSNRRRRPAKAALSRTGRIEHWGLHAKTFAFDRRIGFIGSYNLDPRSNKLNTEMGVLYDCPELAKASARADRNASSLEHVSREIDGQSTRLGDGRRNGKKCATTPSPTAGFMKRVKAQVIGWLPIEWLL